MIASELSVKLVFGFRVLSPAPRIAFVAVDLRWEDQTGNFAPFSYASYKLEAAIRSRPEFAHIETRVLDLASADPEVFVAALDAFRPTLVAASTYLWSVGTFTELARRLKRTDPSIAFVMGGPSARRSVLELEPYRDALPFIDAIVTGEGEDVIVALARAGGDWREQVPGLTFPAPLGWRTTASERPVLDDFATPYQVGRAPDGKMGYIETFRGCPIQCAFCQWGEQRADRVHSVEYLTENLRCLDASGVKDVLFLDAAFNLNGRAFRNLLEAERHVGALTDRRTTGHIYPIELKSHHFEFMESVGDFRGCIGIQSFDEDVLKRLGRPLENRRLEATIASLRGRIPIDAEFILGLPGDNPKSFRNTFQRSLELCDTVRVFWCLALPDALLERASEFDIRFDPTTFKLESCTGWTLDDLRREWNYMLDYGARCRNLAYGDNWLGFATAKHGEPAPRALIHPHGVSTEPALEISPASPDDRYFDYCLQPYRPRRPVAGKYRSENLLWQSLLVGGALEPLKPPLEALQQALGRDLTVWGVKWDGRSLFWELYFYDPKKEAPESRLSALAETLAPWLAIGPRVSEGTPYMMVSFDLDAEAAKRRAISEVNLYLTGESGHAGRSYKLGVDGLELENTYRFLEPKRHIDELLPLVKSSTFVDFSRPETLSKLLIPELFACKKLCVAKKRRSDGVYFSGISVEQLRWFVQRFEYPKPLVRFLAKHAARFEHLYFDVGLDYRTDPKTGKLVYPKTSFYGTL